MNGQWVRRFPAHSPFPSRAGSALIFDTTRNKTLLFGGVHSCCSFLGDTWEWNGTDWTQLSPAQAPFPRQWTDMAYDSQRSLVVLFGGRSGETNYDDTWEWDGVNWTQRFPAHGPSPRYRFRLTYNSARQVTVLYGGITLSGDHLHDTWEWDGVDWTQRISSQAPFVSNEYALSYDEVRGVTVLFGGSGVQGEIRNETWEWDGTDWTQTTPSNVPMSRLGHSMIYDAGRQSVILFGGDNYNNLLDDTWEYQIPQFPVPSGTSQPSSVFRLIGPTLIPIIVVTIIFGIIWKDLRLQCGDI